MEYSSDALAQAAYVTNGTYGSDLCTGGTASASSEYSGTYSADKACDDNATTYWASGNGLGHNQTWQYDLGDGNAKTIAKLTVQNVGDYGINAFMFSGSNNGSSWTELYSGNASNNEDVQEFAFSNQTAYRYYKIYETSGYNGGFCAIREIQFLAISLQCYSESTIKTQGSYSLKGIATTDAVDKTLTRTIGSPIDLTGVDTLRFDIRSSRTGSNIKIGIHDSGGTTSEKTHSVSSANTWELCVWDISAVADANKDAIDSIIVTIANADSANTFYIDNFLSAEDVTVTAEPIIVTTGLSSSGAVIFLGYGYVYEESSSGAGMDVSARTKASVGNALLKRKNLKYIYHLVNTHGKDVTMTIYIDGTAHSHTFTINTTTRKVRRIEDVPNMEGYKFDVKLSCDDVTDTDLEIYAPITLHHTTYGE